MSRHRAVRNLDIDDVLDEGDYEDDLDEAQMSAEDLDALEDGLIYVYSVVGEDIPMTNVEIKEALWYYYFDREETVKWVLDQVSKAKAKAAKVETAAAAAAKDDYLQHIPTVKRKARYRRPPSKLFSSENIISAPPLPISKTPSLKTLASTRLQSASGSSASKLLQLRNKMASATETLPPTAKKDPSVESTETKPTPSATPLSVLAQKSSQPRAKSSLLHLASRQSQVTNNGKTSIGQTSLASLAQKPPTKKLTSLSHLASRSRPNDVKQIPEKQVSVATPAINTPTVDPSLLSKTTAIIKSTSPEAPPATIPTSTTIPTSVKQDSLPTAELPDSVELPKTMSVLTRQLNPLCALPSPTAEFLFTRSKATSANGQVQQLISSLPSTIGQAFYEAMQSSAATVCLFPFDMPSPDDVVLNAQSYRSVSKPVQSKGTTKIKPSKPSKPTIAIDVGDDEVEYLSDDSNNQLHQDMAGLGLGSIKSSKKQTSQVKSSEHTSAASISTENNTNSPLPSPLTKIHPSKRINVIEEYAKRSSEKPKLNLVVIGHVDAGKSTLMGHFLYSLGQVNDRVMKKYERDSQKIGKGSFAYAWVLDETDEERERGITMDIAMNNFETLHRKFTLLDAPGHRDFIPNMISGTSQADVAILVVDAAIGGFESGFDGNGQTKEHALLARSLGVQQMIIAINKLDVMAWDKSRFDEIVTKVGAFLVQAGFRKSNLSYVPVSGLTGDNLTSPSQSSELIAWYNGPSLLELIDMFEPPVRLLDKPFRMSTSDFFKGGVGSSSGVSIAGTIDAGSLQVGEQVVVIPGGESGTVKAMQVNDESANWCAAGDSVLITFSGLDILSLSTGCVLCSTSHPVSMTTTFVAQIVVFDIKVPITCGFPVILYHHSVNEPASIVKLLTTVDKATGEVIKKNPRHLTKGNTATIKIQLTNRPIPLELFKDNKQLGRIMLRKGGDTVAAGVVTKILTFGS